VLILCVAGCRRRLHLNNWIAEGTSVGPDRLVFVPGIRFWDEGLYGEFDPGSGLTLAACLTHASRTVSMVSAVGIVADG
jgi:hypothetical protein